MPKDFDIQKLKGNENYHTWQFAMKNLLAYNGLSKCIETVDVEATTNAAATVRCAETDASKRAKAKAIIILAIEQSIYVHINKCNDAVSVWTTLQKLYEDTGLSRKIGLLRSLIQCRLEDCNDMQDFIDKIMSAANKLTGIGFGISDEWLGAILLAGLTEKYEPMIMSIESNNQEISADAIISKLMDMKQSNSNGEAFIGKGKFNKNKRKGKKNNVANKKRECFICGSEQHLANACPQKKTDNKSDKQKVKTNTESAFIAIESACVSNETGKNEYEPKVKLDTENATMVGLLSICKRDEWYVDSGASNHMSPFHDILSGIKKPTISAISTADNAQLKVECMGRSRLKLDNESVTVNDILHIPKLSANLLSVYKMVCHGNTIIFDSDGCKIYNGNMKLLQTIKAVNGVYKLHAPTEEICMLANKSESNAMLWHRRFGHLNYGTLCKLNDAVIGLCIKHDDKQIKQCKVCDLGKQQRKPFPSSETRTKNILELVHTDLCGPMENKSLGGARYMLTFTDDYSRKTFLFFLTEKSQVFKKLVEFRKSVEKETECTIKCLRSDNGMEYMSKQLDEYCKENGIKHQLTCVYTPEQNGVAERANRTIIEKARCMIFDSNLPKSFWAEACHTAAHVMNCTPRIRLQQKTPIEMWCGEKPIVSDFRIFGSKVMVHVPKEKRRKWSPKSSEMIFVGYDQQKKGFRCYDSESSKVIVSRDVNFYETFSSTVMMNDVEDQNDDIQNIEATQPVVREDTPSPAREDVVTEPAEPGSIDVNLQNEQLNDSIDEYLDVNDDETSKDADFTTRANVQDIGTRASERNKVQVRPFQITHFALFVGEPQTLTEAKNHADANKWLAAMNEELNAHCKNNTWTLAELPAGRKAIKSKWVYKAKKNDMGDIIRYKARIVAKGYAQTYGVDYFDTYAPVVRHDSIRMLMAQAAQNGFKIHQMDAITAFLQGDLEEEIYLMQPEGFEDQTNRVCKLNRAIYGLKQAGLVWNKKLDESLKKMGFTRCKSDPCVYFNLKIMIAIYVDDFLIFYRNQCELNALKRMLNEAFHMKDVGTAEYCLGFRIRQSENCIELDQTGYINEIIKRFGMNDAKTAVTPSDPNQKLSTDMYDEQKSLVGVVPYQEAVGCLLYVSNGTRPDISFATNNVSRFNAKHSEPHWTAVKRIIRYLKGTTSLKLKYHRSGNTLEMIGFTDADWASEIDERRSCTGNVIVMTGGAVTWMSKRQPIVALSSTEAEYIALSSMVKEIIWARHFINEVFQMKLEPTTIRCDNQSAIDLSKNDMFRQRSKHIDIRYHHVRECIVRKIVKVEFIGTEYMTADVLTKAVFGDKQKLCAKLMGIAN